MDAFKRNKSLKILLTNIQIESLTGSEIFTFTIAKHLKSAGHSVTVYSKFIGPYAKAFGEINVQVISKIKEIKNKKFDVAHIHHNINAIEVRHLFPGLPMIFLSHGVLPFLEQPPPMELNISKFLAVSEEVKDNLIKMQIADSKIIIFRNMVDNDLFTEIKPINPSIKKALVLSYKIDRKTQSVIKDACMTMGVEAIFVGKKDNKIYQSQLTRLINQVDVVFSLGRGVIETMFCGRIPIILDRYGGDGMVLPHNFTELMKYNFSGRYHNRDFTVKELIYEMEKYNKQNGKTLKKLALNNFRADILCKKLINTYCHAIDNFHESTTSVNKIKLTNYVEIINEVSTRTRLMTEKKIKTKKVAGKKQFQGTMYNSGENNNLFINPSIGRSQNNAFKKKTTKKSTY